VRHAYTIAGLLLLASPAPAQQLLMNFFPPQYTSCDTAAPLFPLYAPNSALDTWNRVAAACRSRGDTTSALAEMVVMTSMTGAVPAGHAVVQVYQGAGVLSTTTNDCGDTPTPLRSAGIEYFTVGSPAIDAQIKVMCCETTLVYDFKAVAAVLPLPAGAQPIPPGEMAAEAYTTVAQRDALNRRVQGSARKVTWGYRYEYDGCRPQNPRTSCGNVHCLSTWQQF
jgi:hypothetical protein